MARRIARAILRGVARTKTHSAAFDHDEASGRKLVCVFMKRVFGQCCMGAHGLLHQSDDPNVCPAVQHGQGSKILVECYEHPPFGSGPREDRVVTGIARPFTDPRDVMAERAQLLNGARRHARVEKQLHFASTVSAIRSRRSARAA